MTRNEHLTARGGLASEERLRRRSAIRLAGLLLIAGAATGAAAHGTLPDHASTGLHWGPAAVAVAVGMVCQLAPCRGRGWLLLHFMLALATVLIATVIIAHGDQGRVYTPLLIAVAAFAAFAFQSRRTVAAHVVGASAALFAPVVHGSVPMVSLQGLELLDAFALVSVTWLLVVVRERMESGQAALRHLAESDPLTGVGNYRRLHGRMGYEIARHRRNGQPFALLLLDLNGFKSVNDTLGHPAGDVVLKDVATTLLRVVRGQDTVVRQGGDEFAVLAPETDAAAAEALARRVERGLDALGIGQGPVVSASVGWAVFPHDGEEASALVDCADIRQRAAKRARRAAPPMTTARLSA